MAPPMWEDKENDVLTLLLIVPASLTLLIVGYRGGGGYTLPPQ
jgi:hypothetical protein